MSSIVIGKAHVAGVGNLFLEGPLKVIESGDGRFLLAVDSDTDAVAIELSTAAADELRRKLGPAGGMETADDVLAMHHAETTSLVRKTLGVSPTLADILIRACDKWPDEGEAKRFRGAIASVAYAADRASADRLA